MQTVGLTLGVEPARVFPLSARQALTARVLGDEAALAASRLPALESALLSQLLPQRCKVIGRLVQDGVQALQQSGLRRLGERQRQTTEQLAELCSLRGKSGSRLKLMSGRLDAEAADFERCAPKLLALRSVLVRQLHEVLEGLATEPMRLLVQRMRDDTQSSLLKLGAGRAFGLLGQRLKALLSQADQRSTEIEQMLQASQRALNAEFGFSLSCAPRPALERFERELARIEDNYRRYVGVTQLWRMTQAGFNERFSQMLLSRLRVVFEGAAGEIEQWARAVSHQIDEQLRERRQAVQQRRLAFERIRVAEDGLERGIQDLASEQARLQALAEHINTAVDSLLRLAANPAAAEGPDRTPGLQRVRPQAQALSLV